MIEAESTGQLRPQTFPPLFKLEGQVSLLAAWCAGKHAIWSRASEHKSSGECVRGREKQTFPHCSSQYGR
jgi:hypothetical protein